MLVASATASQKVKDQADYVCNGKNDQEEIQFALDSSSLVRLSEGEFNISESLLVNTDSSLIGSGVSTVIKLADNKNVPVITTKSVYTFFVHLADFRIDGNKDNQQEGKGIDAKFAHTWLIQNLHIKNTKGHGINIKGDGGNIALNNRVVNCRIENAGAQAIFVDSYAPNNHFVGNIIGGTENYFGIECANDENIFVDNHIHGAAESGIFVTGSNNIFTGNIVESSGNHGYLIQGNGNRLSACIAFNNADNGFSISGDGNLVTGSRAFDRQGTKTQDYGVELAVGAENNIVTNNHLLDSEHVTAGFVDNSGTTNIVSNNIS